MKEYTGTTYIGVVGGDLEYGNCRDSIERMLRLPADEPPRSVRATKGYEARQMHINKFLQSRHDFILLLDHDMLFAPDTLQRLRSHRLPYVTGAYMRRQYKPIAPVWFEYNPRGYWPNRPAMSVPVDDKLIKVGASGWGCILLHREVILSVRQILHDEWEVLEDDMDIWPYDLKTVMSAINGLAALVDEKPSMRVMRPALEQYTAILQEQIRPLRGTKDVVGSDVRFPFFAKVAGYDLWLDPNVTPGHVLHYPLTADDFLGMPEEKRQEYKRVNDKHVRGGRRAWKRRLKELGEAEL